MISKFKFDNIWSFSYSIMERWSKRQGNTQSQKNRRVIRRYKKFGYIHIMEGLPHRLHQDSMHDKIYNSTIKKIQLTIYPCQLPNKSEELTPIRE